MELRQAGYSTAEKKLAALRQGDYKQIVIPNDSDSYNFELLMHTKVEIFVAQLFARNPNDVKTPDDFFKFARDYMA